MKSQKKCDDNRIKNLELWAINQPRGQRVKDLVKWAHQIIKIYKNNMELF